MSYQTQADITDDGDLRRRVVACAALEGTENPDGWAAANRWALAAQPGWVEAYADAVAKGNERPGRDEAGITDEMILAAVQVLAQPDPSPSP